MDVLDNPEIAEHNHLKGVADSFGMVLRSFNSIVDATFVSSRGVEFKFVPLAAEAVLWRDRFFGALEDNIKFREAVINDGEDVGGLKSLDSLVSLRDEYLKRWSSFENESGAVNRWVCEQPRPPEWIDPMNWSLGHVPEAGETIELAPIPQNEGAVLDLAGQKFFSMRMACQAALDVLPNYTIDPSTSIESQVGSEKEYDEMVAVDSLRKAMLLG